jgi:putative transposase
MTAAAGSAVVVAHPRMAEDERYTSAEELAAVLGCSDRRVRQRADEEGWLAIEVPGRGGRRKLFALRALPEEIRTAVLANRIRTAAPPPSPVADAGAAVAPRRGAANTDRGGMRALSGRQMKVASARRALLIFLDDQAQALGLTAAVDGLVAAAAAGELPDWVLDVVIVANARAGEARTLSARTLMRWRGLVAGMDLRSGADVDRVCCALAPRDEQQLRASPPWAHELLRLYRRPTKPSLAACMEDLPGVLPPGCPVPSYAQARRYLKAFAPAERERGRHGPAALLKRQGHKRLSTDHLRPMELVTGDGHTFKADVAHPVHGRPFRPEVAAIMDTATRRVVGWSAGLAESQQVVMDALRMAVERHGLFGALRSDNGGGFTGELMASATTGLLGRLEAGRSLSTPGRAQARGKIERLQQSLFIRAAKRLPTYAGKDMDREARKAVSTRVEREIRTAGASRILISWADFLAFVEQEVAAYNARPHRALPKVRDPQTHRLRHLSPAEAWERAEAAGWEPERLPPAAIDQLWRPHVVRRALRGWVRLPWGAYYHEALVALDGQEVRVGYDVHDGARVWIRDASDALVCVAGRDGNTFAEVPDAASHAARQRRVGRAKRLVEKLALVEAEGPHRAVPEPDAPDPGGDDVHDLLARGLARLGRS